jgi:circadian clock protein KaiC
MNDRIATTGIAGLDEILRGGLPRNRVYLVQGRPGTGKTTLALQFLLRGARDGERCLYVSLSESLDEVQEVARSHGWDLSAIDVLELSAAEQLIKRENQNSVFRTSSVELSETEALISERIAATRPQRVVIDSLAEVHLLAAEPWIYRLQLLRLKQSLAGIGATAMLLDDLALSDAAAQPSSVVHGSISLSYEAPEYGSFRRRLRVDKMRGVPFLEGEHDLAIRTGGLKVYPRLVAAELGHPGTDGRLIRSGVAELDEVLGGGMDAGTTNLIIGPAGVGKSTVAMRFAINTADLGGRAAVYMFDERVDTMVRRWKGLGCDLEPYLAGETIALRHIDPAELTAGELAFDIRRAVEGAGVSLVIIDSLAGYQQAMVGERAMVLQMHELQTYLGNHGVTTIVVNAQHGLFASPTANLDISYLADTVLLLRYYEFMGTIRKALSVFKRRTGQHEPSIRDLEFRPQGIFVGRPLTEFQGILTGSPIYKSASMPFGGLAVP